MFSKRISILGLFDDPMPMENIPYDGYIQIASVFFSTFLAVYTYRLVKFFKQGIFYRSYRFLWPAFTFYAIGSFFDVFPELNLGPQWFHAIHATTYAVFFILMTLSIYTFYRTWSEMGMKEV